MEIILSREFISFLLDIMSYWFGKWN